jgi:hypothetical protein
MQRIFRDAKQVLVWLDPDSHNAASNAFKRCRILGQRTMVRKEFEALITTALDTQAISTAWSSLSRLVQCHWWKRVWIIQEAVLAQDLLFFWGAEVIQCAYIDLAIANLQTSLESLRQYPFSAWNHEPVSQITAIRD